MAEIEEIQRAMEIITSRGATKQRDIYKACLTYLRKEETVRDVRRV